eukprot:TRINITY_DN16025_c0_g1_i1.p1 TRINITY_DN16025_c0_g1~~TRINITY_DN16025_c0_g1_i1.p1  ORF type:complete len:826 (+),score=110.45 TRINITY_DN16025_c0_g1_i1:43-2520(+)
MEQEKAVWLGTSRLWERAFGVFVRGTLREEDSEDERARKWIIIPFCMGCSVLFSFMTVNAVKEEKIPGIILESTMLLIFLIEWARAAITKRITRNSADFLMLSSGFFLILQDWSTYGFYDTWMGMTIVMDVCLLVSCSADCQTFLQFVTVCYIIAKMFEEAEQVGLYEVFPNNTGRETVVYKEGDWYVALIVCFTRMYIFLGDFALTRRFAHGMRSGKQKAEESVVLTELVAQEMARFDLKAAGELVEGEGERCGLHQAFSELLKNLHLYEPFLPSSLFSGNPSMTHISDDQENPGYHRAPPGLNGQASIMFCTIENINMLWEQVPILTRKAIQTYRHLARSLLEEHGGYEVKTIGDGLMLSFDNSVAAVNYSIDLHQAVMETRWADLTRIKGFEKYDDWNGPRLRIGIHHGPVEIEPNSINSTCEYLGPVVGIAASIEMIGIGGATCVSNAVLKDCEGKLGSEPLVLGGGFAEAGSANIKTSIVINQALPSRLSLVEEVLAERRKNSCRVLYEDQPTRLVAVSELNSALTCHLKHADAVTIAHVRTAYSCLKICDDPVEAVNEIISCVLECLQRTEGTVVTVLSTSVIASWNVSKKCQGHRVHSVLFAGLLYRDISSKIEENRCHSIWTDRVNLSLVTGSVLHGNVGNNRHKFVVVIGACAEAAHVVSETAAEVFGCFVLHVALPGHKPISQDPSMATMCRPVDKWSIMENNKFIPVVLHQLREERLIDGVGGIFYPDDPETDWEWSSAYIKAFAGSDYEALSQSLDPVVQKVMHILQDVNTSAMDVTLGAVSANSFAIRRGHDAFDSYDDVIKNAYSYNNNYE